MLDVCLLGTSGMMPLPKRYLTSMLARYNGLSILVDCGEGTQMAMRSVGLSPNPVGVMCFTHYHADHISGLPGMLLNMANAERTEELLMIGPKGLTRVVNALRVIAPELPFPIRFHRLQDFIGIQHQAGPLLPSLPLLFQSLAVEAVRQRDRFFPRREIENAGGLRLLPEDVRSGTLQSEEI